MVQVNVDRLQPHAAEDLHVGSKARHQLPGAQGRQVTAQGAGHARIHLGHRCQAHPGQALQTERVLALQDLGRAEGVVVRVPADGTFALRAVPLQHCGTHTHTHHTCTGKHECVSHNGIKTGLYTAGLKAENCTWRSSETRARQVPCLSFAQHSSRSGRVKLARYPRLTSHRVLHRLGYPGVFILHKQLAPLVCRRNPSVFLPFSSGNAVSMKQGGDRIVSSVRNWWNGFHWFRA